MKKLLWLPLLLTACNPPHVQTITQRVYCLTPDQYAQILKNRPAKVGDSLTGNAQKDFKKVTNKDVLLEVYVDGVLKVLGSCIGR